MPLFIPFLLVGGAALLGGVGVKKGIDGLDDLKRARAIADAAQGRHAWWVRRTEDARDDVNARAAAYGREKLATRDRSFGRLVAFLRRLETRGGLDRIRALHAVDVTHDEVRAFHAEVLEAQTALAGLVQAGVAGATVASATYGLAGTVGVASTGAAISGLSGAAATSATLAWLGGGSLAAGGFGMAGGMVVLGGVVAGPALALGGLLLAARGEAALTQATAYAAEVERAVADLATVTGFLETVGVRVDEMRTVVARLRARLDAHLDRLEARGDAWRPDDDRDAAQLQSAVLLARALSDVFKTPVLDERGLLSTASAAVVARYRELPD